MSDVGVLVSLDDQSIEQSKVVLDYTSRDFTAIRSQLIGLAKGMMPEWQTAGEASDFGTLILELFAYMGDVLNFYIDRTASEAFLGTAVRRQSVLYIADMLGYTPIGQQAASVALYFSVDPEVEEGIDIVLPKGTRVHNEADDAEDLIIFETESEVTLKSGDTDIQVYAIEGILVKDAPMGPSQGTPNTEFIIPEKGVVYGTVRVVTLEGFQVVHWSHTSDLGLARPTQAVFTTYIDDTEMTHVVFGDNAAGRIPPVNAEIYASYRFGKGAEANDLAAESLTTIAPVSNLDLTLVTVHNKEAPVGGTDPESIDSMRYSIPRAANRLKQRAVTLNDYANLAMQVPGVAKSVSYGTVYTAVHVRIAPQEGKSNPVYMKRLCLEVESYMREKILIGSTVYAEPYDVEELWHDVYIRILVHSLDAFNRTSVRQQVDTVVRSLMAFNSVDFGFRISIGAIYRAVLAVQGVEYAELQWLSTEPPPSEIIFFPGMENPPQAELFSLQETATTLLFQGVWGFGVRTEVADPWSGNFRENANLLVFAVEDNAGDDYHEGLADLKPGDHFVMYEANNPLKWSSRIVTMPVTDHTTWVVVPNIVLQTSFDAETGDANPPAASTTDIAEDQTITPSGDITGGVLEVQRVTPSGTISGGTFTMNVMGTVTSPIQWNALAPDIQAAVDAAAPGDGIIVGGGPVNVTSFTLTYPSALGNPAQVTVASSLTGGGTLTPSTDVVGIPSSFTLTVLNVTTPSIQWDATDVQIKAAIDTALPGNTIEVVGGPIHTTPVRLTFTGYGDVPLTVPDIAFLTGIGDVALTVTVTQETEETLCRFEFIRYMPTPITPSGDVQNIETPELVIPRIEPTEKTEPPETFEDMSEDERTHDGLWVYAVGGLPNT